LVVHRKRAAGDTKDRRRAGPAARAVEVNCRIRAQRRSRGGKSDTLDAIVDPRAAAAAGQHAAVQRNRFGDGVAVEIEIAAGADRGAADRLADWQNTSKAQRILMADRERSAADDRPAGVGARRL